MRNFKVIVWLMLISSITAIAAEPARNSSALSFDQTIDRVVEREHTFVTTMKRMHPLVETYVQNLREDGDHNAEPADDQYFLGRLDLNAAPRCRFSEKASRVIASRV